MNNYDPREGIKYAEASKRWANLGILLIIFATGIGIWWFTERYYGPDGVRVLGLVLGVLCLVLIVIGVGFGVSAITGGLFMRYFIGVLTGLVRFQEADDRGEIARSLVGVAKIEKQQERDILRIAGALGRGQATAIVQAQRGADRQQTVDAERAWFDAPARFDDEDAHNRIPEGW